MAERCRRKMVATALFDKTSYRLKKNILCDKGYINNCRISGQTSSYLNSNEKTLKKVARCTIVFETFCYL